MLSRMNPLKGTSRALKYRGGTFGILSGALISLGLLLAGCGVAPENTSAPTLIQPTNPPVPLPTPTVPATAPAPTPTSTPLPSPTAQPTFPDPAGYDWAPILSGLELPVDIQNAGDGSGRLFIVEKRGRILILKDNQLMPAPFLDIVGKVDSRHTEQGLLGLAFHPDFSRSGLFFVNYIDLNGNTVIARLHVSSDDPNRADLASEVDLLHVAQPYDNHNGGGLAFGPDGYLYIGLGDGGSAGDPMGNGQNVQTRLGKILRIDVDHGDPYAIPPDNPFAKSGGLPEIWAYGLRNPWRFSFDRLTGDMFIADVGQDAWEEVDMIPTGTPGGMNFGWSYFEGMHPIRVSHLRMVRSSSRFMNIPIRRAVPYPEVMSIVVKRCRNGRGSISLAITALEIYGVCFSPAGKDQQVKILFTTGATDLHFRRG